MGNPMTFKSKIAIGCLSAVGLIFIIWLLKKRKINEELFYLWFIVFCGIFIIGISRRIQIALTELIGTYSPVSSMIFLALGFVFGACLVYSILISDIKSNLRDITSYIGEIRLDVDEIMKTTSRDSREDDETLRPLSAKKQ
jgi:hypothetical protein